ncbi:MAG: beta-aspartyl-peptidase [Halanaerobiales bacterium]
MSEFRLFKNLNVYTPRSLGVNDILVYGGWIVEIKDNIKPPHGLECRIVEMDGEYCVPGFIDGHVHLIGGGGEGGFVTRTSPGEPDDFLNNGITTIIGLLGTDGVTRTHSELLAQARKFSASGLSVYLVTGSYAYPPVTLLGSVEKDIVYIPEYIGTGEIAIADHRGSGISPRELKRLVLETGRGGMLAGKAGKVILHTGRTPERLSLLEEVVEAGDVLPAQMLPTHINSSAEKLTEGKKWIKGYGGYIDLTADEETADCVKVLIEEGIPMENLLISSDAWGSLPVFNEKGELESIKRAEPDSLLFTLQKLVLENGISLEKALKLFTTNVADFFALDREGLGRIKKDNLADFIILDRELNIKGAVVRGNHKSFF